MSDDVPCTSCGQGTGETDGMTPPSTVPHLTVAGAFRGEFQTSGVRYVAGRCTQRLAETGAVASVGSSRDSSENGLAEASSSPFKAELIRHKDPWESIDDLEIAVAEYVDWFSHRRLHGEIGLVPPAEYEDASCRHHAAPATAEAALPSLRRTRHETGQFPRAADMRNDDPWRNVTAEGSR